MFSRPDIESSSNRQAEIANRQPSGKRFSLIGKPTAIVRSVTGQFQAIEAEQVESTSGNVPTASAQSALAGMDNQLFFSKYQLELPSKADIQRFLEEKIREVGDG